MKDALSRICLLYAIFSFIAITPALADEPEYANLYELQAVTANGSSNFTGTFPLKIKGVLLNNPADMLDSTANFNTFPFTMGGQWQVFVNVSNDPLNPNFGGAAVFMGQNYGNFPDFFPPGDPAASYTNDAWNAEIARVSSSNGHLLQQGDLVEIRARAGLSFGGKFNLNEGHLNDPSADFEIIYLGSSPGLPTPVPITLASIWDESLNRVLFDPARDSGGEFYQGAYVDLQNVRLLESSPWGINALAKVADLESREFNLRLGRNPGFATLEKPDGFFNVLGIFNQEAGAAGPFTQGYEVWVLDPHAFTAVPEPATFLLALLACISMFLFHRWTR